MNEIIERVKANRKISPLQNKKDYYQLGKFLKSVGNLEGISKNTKWAARRTFKYYDGVNFEGPSPRQLTKMKAKDFNLVVKGRQQVEREALLEESPPRTELSRDQNE